MDALDSSAAQVPSAPTASIPSSVTETASSMNAFIEVLKSQWRDQPPNVRMGILAGLAATAGATTFFLLFRKKGKVSASRRTLDSSASPPEEGETQESGKAETGLGSPERMEEKKGAGTEPKQENDGAADAGVKKPLVGKQKRDEESTRKKSEEERRRKEEAEKKEKREREERERAQREKEETEKREREAREEREKKEREERERKAREEREHKARENEESKKREEKQVREEAEKKRAEEEARKQSQATPPPTAPQEQRPQEDNQQKDTPQERTVEFVFRNEAEVTAVNPRAEESPPRGKAPEELGAAAYQQAQIQLFERERVRRDEAIRRAREELKRHDRSGQQSPSVSAALSSDSNAKEAVSREATKVAKGFWEAHDPKRLEAQKRSFSRNNKAAAGSEGVDGELVARRDSYNVFGLMVRGLEAFHPQSDLPEIAFPVAYQKFNSSEVVGAEIGVIVEDLHPLDGEVDPKTFAARSIENLCASFNTVAPQAIRILHSGPSSEIVPCVFEHYTDLLIYRSEDPAEAIIVAFVFAVLGRTGYAIHLTVPQRLYESALPLFLKIAETAYIDPIDRSSHPLAGHLEHHFLVQNISLALQTPLWYTAEPPSPKTFLSVKSRFDGSRVALLPHHPLSSKLAVDDLVISCKDPLEYYVHGRGFHDKGREFLDSIPDRVQVVDVATGTPWGATTRYCSTPFDFSLPGAGMYDAVYVCEHPFKEGLLSVMIRIGGNVSELQIGLLSARSVEEAYETIKKALLGVEENSTSEELRRAQFSWKNTTAIRLHAVENALGPRYIMRGEGISLGEERWLVLKWVVHKCDWARVETYADSVLDTFEVRE